MPDSSSRTGIRTNSYGGQVPKFWNEIKDDFKHGEFIKSSNQDGCRIGVIYFEEIKNSGTQ